MRRRLPLFILLWTLVHFRSYHGLEDVTQFLNTLSLAQAAVAKVHVTSTFSAFVIYPRYVPRGGAYE